MRLSAKAFVVDQAGRLLLLDCADPARPGVRWWELPGGGVEPGEDEVTATVRERRRSMITCGSPRVLRVIMDPRRRSRLL